MSESSVKGGLPFSPARYGDAARDYAAFRQGFPPSFFARLAEAGAGRRGQRILDIGTGAGTLARGFARAGADVSALDISLPLMREARRLAGEENISVRFAAGRAEALPFREESFDVVSAGQCWIWFDRARAAREAFRVLRPGGILAVAQLDFLPLEGNAAKLAERIVLRYNPGWPLFDSGLKLDFSKWFPDIEAAGLGRPETFCYDENLIYTQEAWRGRLRACDAVISLRDPEKISAFDDELARALAEAFGDSELSIAHRVGALVARKPK